ncbi:DUF2817 domain-containing protein [Candidatus Woesearchaeota archaeon]|nr:DUF2817 domain-containing protein [Candidatus Woesearchaeota archaeon]
MKEYFSDSYEDSRKKFLSAVKSLEVDSICLRDDLFIDFAFKEDGKKKILFLVSGTHGVEGYLGSAAQLIFIKEFLPKLKGVSVCLVHGLNPFGFKHNRRVNENNVDLNRNSVYDERLMLGIPNSFFSNVWSDSLLFLKLNRPRKHRLLEVASYYSLVFKTVIRSGIKNTINVGMNGQSSYPRSVGFKGVKLEDSLLHLRSFIEEKTQGYEEAFFIDFHSGIGKKYDVIGFTSKKSDSQEFSFIKALLPKLRSRDNTSFVNHSGSVSDLFLARSHASKNIDLIFEYGTVPLLSSRLVLDYLAKLNIEENQVFFFGSDKARIRISKRLKNAYSPDDITFRKSLIRKTSVFFNELIKNWCEK